MKILNGLESTETGVKVDPQLMTEVDLWQRIYGSNGLKTDIFPIDYVSGVLHFNMFLVYIRVQRRVLLDRGSSLSYHTSNRRSPSLWCSEH